MNRLSLLLLFASASAAPNSTIFLDHALQKHDEESNRRQYLLQDSTCTLFRQCVTYSSTEDYPKGHDEHSWICELSKQDAERLNVQFVDVVESSTITAILANATSGASTLTLSEARIDQGKPQLYIPENALVEVRNGPLDQSKSRILYPSGSANGERAAFVTLRALVIRLTDKNNIAPDASVAQLKNDVFDDAVSLKTQTEACSYGKLKIEPFRGYTPNNRYYISNGIVDVKMNYDITIDDGSRNDAAFAAAVDLIGDLEDPMFDLVMFCFPPGSPSKSFLASAVVNGKYSFYNNQWCGYVSALMHEVGHNINLAHSGHPGASEVDDEYGDTAGYMGFSAALDDERKCYNPQKNYQLGWYADKVNTINPLDGIGSREFVLNGVSDYERNNDALIVLRLKQINKEQDYYVGYNRAVGINEDTTEDRDMITIIRKEDGGPESYGESTKVASLGPGRSHVIENFNGNRNIQISFIGILNGDATILVIDNDEPIAQPTEQCQEVTIELTTDRFPDDNSWYIVDTVGIGYIGATSPIYTEQEKIYSQRICLPTGTNRKFYKFTILDKYGDGVCCLQGIGSYKAFDDKGSLIFSGENGEFKTREHLIEVTGATEPPSPNPTRPPTRNPTKRPTQNPTQKPTRRPTQNPTLKPTRRPTQNPTQKPTRRPTRRPTQNPTQNPTRRPTQKPTSQPTKLSCKNEKENGEVFQIKKDSEEESCNRWAKKGKCDNMIKSGTDKDKLVWHVCKRSCDRCGDEPQTLAISPKPTNLSCHNEKEKGEVFQIKKDGAEETCNQWAKNGKCDNKIRTGTDKDKLVWHVCKRSCDRCGDEPQTLAPSPKPTNLSCHNEKGKGEVFQIKKDGAEKSCNQWEKKGNCNNKIKTGTDKGKFVWQVCKRSCDRCGDEPQTLAPSSTPTLPKSESPSEKPSFSVSVAPTDLPSTSPTVMPSGSPSQSLSSLPSAGPSRSLSSAPTAGPSANPSSSPSFSPSRHPSAGPTSLPSLSPSTLPSGLPSESPSGSPSASPSEGPSRSLSSAPTAGPSANPSSSPSSSPSGHPSAGPNS